MEHRYVWANDREVVLKPLWVLPGFLAGSKVLLRKQYRSGTRRGGVNSGIGGIRIRRNIVKKERGALS